MARFVESMADFWEGIAAFFTLGGRDLANKVGSLVRGIRIGGLDRSIASGQMELGRHAWSLKVLAADTFPIVDRIDSFERAISAKEELLKELRSQISDMQKQRQDHLTLYQNKISELLKQKRPVEDEYTSHLVESRRLKRQLDSTQSEIGEAKSKLELQTGRHEQLAKTESEKSEEYVISEISNEIEFLERKIVLKSEKVDFLKVRLEEKAQNAERTGKVVAQFDLQIADLRKQQNEGTSQFDASLSKLQTKRYQIERDIRKLRTEMTPLFSELGAELRRRPFDIPELTRRYAEIGNLESKKGSLLKEINNLRSESASIGIGIKIGFYGIFVLLIALLVWLIIVLV